MSFTTRTFVVLFTESESWWVQMFKFLELVLLYRILSLASRMMKLLSTLLNLYRATLHSVLI
jgi:hypothetical protein